MNKNQTSTNAITKLNVLIDSMQCAKHKTRLKQLYKPIVEQYIAICTSNNLVPDSNGVDWFDFWKMISQSLKLVAKSNYLLDATENLNKLARIWDHSIVKSADRSHVFFFCQISDDKAYHRGDTTHTRMFYDIAPPDQRLICIFLPHKKQYVPHDFYEVLHEVGHYIGRRKRKERIELYQQAVIAGLCNQIYLRLMQIALEEDNPYNIHANVEESIHLSSWLRELSYDIRKLVTNVYSHLIQDIQKVYSKDIGNISSAVSVTKSNIDSTPWFNSKQKAAAKNALDDGYSSFVIPAVLYALELCWPNVKKQFIEALSIPDANPNSSNNFIKEFYSDILAKLYNEIKSPSSIPAWIHQCESQFKEPGADLFMIRLTELKSWQYIRFVLNSAYNCWKMQAEATADICRLTFLEFFLNESLFPKIVGILYSEFYHDINLIIKQNSLYKARCLGGWCYGDKEKRAQLERAYDLICKALEEYSKVNPQSPLSPELRLNSESILGNMLTIFNPIHQVWQYVNMIKDEFWQRENNEEDISKFIKQTKILIKPFKHSGYIHFIVNLFYSHS